MNLPGHSLDLEILHTDISEIHRRYFSLLIASFRWYRWYYNSKTKSKPIQNLHIVFEKLVKYELCINSEECILGSEEINFFGNMREKDGISPIKEKVDSIQNFLLSNSVHQLRRFVEMLNDISHLFQFLPPPPHLLPYKRTKNKNISLSTEQDKTFEQANEALVNCTNLSYISNNDTLLSLTAKVCCSLISLVTN